MFVAFMSLHILLCDEALLYCIVQVEVIEIQIKLKKGFSILPSLMGQNLLVAQPAFSRVQLARPSGLPSTHPRSGGNPTR
jgi:hypothetical protein